MSNSIKKSAGDVRERIEETLDLSDYLAEIARGVAEAQRALDENSIRTAEELVAKGLTSNWGITATWFRIPEVDVELKLALDLRSPSTEQDASRLICASGNAMYQNTYNFSVNAMSTLKARIVAIPQRETSPPEQAQMDYIKRVQEGLKALKKTPETEGEAPSSYYEGEITGELDGKTKQAIEDFKSTLRNQYKAANNSINLAHVDAYSPVDINPFVYEKLQEELQKQNT
ncbi:hypothetical protein FJZ31_16460 [Candidatus Poribacteria bacterium]|nr:hypothetical protein [Candidatus Poribacteria bacterium]